MSQFPSWTRRVTAHADRRLAAKLAIRLGVVGGLIGGLSAPLMAQTIKPGLWEIKQQAQLDPARQAQFDQAQKQLANLSPEQRKMVEQMMASRGVSMDVGTGGAFTLRSCVTKEQADRAMLPQASGKCEHDIQRSGQVMTGRFRCTEPTSEGSTELVFQGEDRYTTKTEVRTERGGKTELLRSTGEARWLGSDCGNLKPTPSPSAGTR